MRRIATCLLAAALAATGAGELHAQADVLDIGVHAVRADDILEGVTGVGGQLAVNVPTLPLTLRGAVDRFFPDCPGEADGDCGAWGFTVDGNLHLPVPVLSPYASVGVVRRSVDPGDPLAETAETGWALGGGVRFSLGGLALFGEGRRELMDELEDGWVFRLGLVF